MDLIPVVGWWAFYGGPPWTVHRVLGFTILPGPANYEPIVQDLQAQRVVGIPAGVLHEDLIEFSLTGINFKNPLWLSDLLGYEQDIVTSQVV